jgi:nucleoside-triphosphatase
LKKNIFLTGPPSSGKTTVIKKIIPRLQAPAQGFYTEEERIGDRRVGFMMKSLDGRQGYLAHQDIRSEFHIRRYGVSIENIEGIAAGSIDPQRGAIIILDEIGKMECFSEVFRETVLRVLSSSNIVLGTIALGGDDFIRMIRGSDGMDITVVTDENRNILPDVILNKIHTLYNAIFS